MRNTRYFVAPTALLLALGCRDDAWSPTEAAPLSVQSVAAMALAFYQVSGGGVHTCGVTTENRTYCWGNNYAGQLGDGTIGTFRFSPHPIAGGLQFRQISAGGSHTCGVTTDSLAFCWGANESGQLGDGTATGRLAAVAVAGGRKFRQIEAGFKHTCGVTTDHRAFCWGSNSFGQLGDGTTSRRLRPVAVAGARQFRQVAAGSGTYWSHTCGVTTGDVVFCWGSNSYGQLGDSTEVTQRLTPSRVAGGRQFRQVDAGGLHSCAVTTGNRAFCWGNGTAGAIGNGKSYKSFWPRAVTGGLYFTRVSAGEGHVCGETTDNRAFCWGTNEYGQLGDGNAPYLSLTPVAVAGGLTFKQVSAGQVHTCGKTPANVAYCWGNNFNGQGGDGTNINRLTPVPVADPM
jgi:alpha-tubulin suppressor-like RCC1 family protein